MGTKWRMPIAVIGKPTGDGRQFDAGVLTHRDLPLPFRYVHADTGGHKDAVIVGHISKVGKESGGMLPAEGEFYDSAEWPQETRDAATTARMLVDKKVIGPSVDLDQAEMERVPEPKAYAEWKKSMRMAAAKAAHGATCGCDGSMPGYEGPHVNMVRSGRMASATLVHIPAFAELAGHAKLGPIDSGDPNVAGTTSSADLAAVFAHDAGGMSEAAESGEDDGDEDDQAKRIKKALKAKRKAAKKLDPETVKGNSENEALALDPDEGSGIWLTDEQYAIFAAKKKAKNAKDKGPNYTDGKLEQPTDATQSSGDGATWRNVDPNVGGGVDRDKMDSSDFVDPKGRRFPIATCGDVSDAVSSYGRADPKIPFAKFKARLTAIAKRKGCAGSLPDEWKQEEKVTAALVAAIKTWKPPAAYFANPKLPGPTPLTIDDDGRVYGHVATWDTCHVGIGDSCVKPPKSQTGYAYFHTGEVMTAEGERVAVGRLTYGAGHAAGNLGYRAAAEHYDNSANLGALVRAGEDKFGIWVAGAVVPEADEGALHVMRSTPLSGDWRRVGGNLEMVAALHVNTAGFPIPRSRVASGVPMSLVAAGALHPTHHEAQAGVQAALDPTEMGRAIAREWFAEQRRLERQAEEWETLLASMDEALRAEGDDEYAQARAEMLEAFAEELVDVL